MDGRALAFTCVVAMLAGLVAGVFPALQASKTDVNETLKTHSTQQPGGHGARHTLPALMIAEIALALVLAKRDLLVFTVCAHSISSMAR